MDEGLLLSIFVGVEGAHAFSAFMPSYFTVKKFAGSAEDKNSLRSGYFPAIIFNVVLGAIVSAITKRVTPLLIAIAVIIFMLIMYEGAISDVNE